MLNYQFKCSFGFFHLFFLYSHLSILEDCISFTFEFFISLCVFVLFYHWFQKIFSFIYISWLISRNWQWGSVEKKITTKKMIQLQIKNFRKRLSIKIYVEKIQCICWNPNSRPLSYQATTHTTTPGRLGTNYPVS